METKSTDELQSELMSQPNLDEYIKKNAAFFAERSIVDLLTELYNKKNISKAELARQRDLSAPSLFRAAQALPGPSSVHLHRLGGHAGGDADPAQAGVLCPALSPHPAGGHHLPQYSPRHAAGGDQRYPLCPKRENALLISSILQTGTAQRRPCFLRIS